MEEMVNSLNAIVAEDVMEDALGPLGVHGEPDKILHIASRMVRLYEDMMLWAERLRGVALPCEYREITELLVRFSRRPVKIL